MGINEAMKGTNRQQKKKLHNAKLKFLDFRSFRTSASSALCYRKWDKWKWWGQAAHEDTPLQHVDSQAGSWDRWQHRWHNQLLCSLTNRSNQTREATSRNLLEQNIVPMSAQPTLKKGTCPFIFSACSHALVLWMEHYADLHVWMTLNGF